VQFDLFEPLNASLVKAGVDEVGRGCIAGPVVACACFADSSCQLPVVFDSKVLSPKERDDIFVYLSELEGFHFGFGVVSPKRIDEINILQATFEAMRWALKRLPQEFQEVLVDGSLSIPHLDKPQQAIVKGDAKVPLISAASIMAKVYRDVLMQKWAAQYPEYGFAQHKGYGTASHLEAIKKWGCSPIHRLSFAPFTQLPEETQVLHLPFEEEIFA